MEIVIDLNNDWFEVLESRRDSFADQELFQVVFQTLLEFGDLGLFRHRKMGNDFVELGNVLGDSASLSERAKFPEIEGGFIGCSKVFTKALEEEIIVVKQAAVLPFQVGEPFDR